MEYPKLNMEIRDNGNIGGRKPRRLRKEGYIPGVIYGMGKEPVSTKISAADLRSFLSGSGKNSVFYTEFAEEFNVSALIKDIQYHPVTKDVIHIDIQRVSMDEKIETNVPVRIIGAEKVKRNGGIIQHQLHEVSIEALPLNVPKYVNADITDMVPGQNFTASMLEIPEGVTLLTPPDEVILSITHPKFEITEGTVEGTPGSGFEDTGEPEIIGSG